MSDLPALRTDTCEGCYALGYGVEVASALRRGEAGAGEAGAGEGGAGVSTIGPVELEVTP